MGARHGILESRVIGILRGQRVKGGLASVVNVGHASTMTASGGSGDGHRREADSTPSRDVVICAPWWRPMPPIRDGAPEWVIEHTVRRLVSLRPVVLSPWHPALEEITFDEHVYRHVRPDVVGGAAAHLPYRFRKRLFGTGDPKGVAYIHGLTRHLRTLRPHIVIAHAIPRLAIEIRRALPTARLVYYDHTNLLKDMSQREWIELVGSIDCLITVCETALHSVVDVHGPLAVPARAILNGVDLDDFSPRGMESQTAVRMRLGLGDGPVVVYCGRLTPRKGVEQLLDAFSRVRREIQDAQLLIVGAATHMSTDLGDYGEGLVRLATICGENAVRFAGYVPSTALSEILSAADVGVLPSVAEEGLPLAILEFAASGLPVLATDVGGAREVIRDDVEGYVLSRANLTSSLYDRLLAVMGDASLRKRLGESARARVEANFSWNRVAQEFEETVWDLM